jgi:hypothetical protein
MSWRGPASGDGELRQNERSLFEPDRVLGGVVGQVCPLVSPDQDTWLGLSELPALPVLTR